MSRAAYCVLLGLTFLGALPGVGAKVVGTVLELMAVFIVIKVIRGKRPNRMVTGATAPAPEPYANLQAAMARLRETEDKESAGRV